MKKRHKKIIDSWQEELKLEKKQEQQELEMLYDHDNKPVYWEQDMMSGNDEINKYRLL